MVIYKATSPSGKVYIGKTVQPLWKRKSQHWTAATKRSTVCKFSAALLKYGLHGLIWEVLEKTDDYNTLNALECWYIEHYDSINNGYNICVGGDIGTYGRKTSDVAKEKLRQVNLGRTDNYERTYERYCRIHNEKNWPWIAAYDKDDKLITIKRKAKEVADELGCSNASIYHSLIGKHKRYDGITFKKLYKEDIKQLNITI